jgi:hypothetical protein
MLDVKSILLMLSSTSWGVVTAFLVGILVYRGTLSLREDDQIFLDEAERTYVEEQETILSRIARVQGLVVALSLASAMLLVVTATIWIYQGYSSF